MNHSLAVYKKKVLFLYLDDWVHLQCQQARSLWSTMPLPVYQPCPLIECSSAEGLQKQVTRSGQSCVVTWLHWYFIGCDPNASHLLHLVPCFRGGVKRWENLVIVQAGSSGGAGWMGWETDGLRVTTNKNTASSVATVPKTKQKTKMPLFLHTGRLLCTFTSSPRGHSLWR